MCCHFGAALTWLVVLSAGLAAAPANSAEPAALLRVAVYDGSDGTASGPIALQRILTPAAGFTMERLRPEEVRSERLRTFDVLILPGGSGSQQARRLGSEGCEAICDFVRDGGGYVGICAGSYLASSDYDWSLHLLNAKVLDRAHWARGNGEVRIALTTAGRQTLTEPAEELPVRYGQGPLLAHGTRDDLPEYEELATFVTEVHKEGVPGGVMPGTTAIARAPYGAGRVICFSPHPETAGGPNHLIAAGVRWAGGDRQAPVVAPRPGVLGRSSL